LPKLTGVNADTADSKTAYARVCRAAGRLDTGGIT
jgi:hypothetical protein